MHKLIQFLICLEGTSSAVSQPTPSCQATRRWGGSVSEGVMWSGGLSAWIPVTTHGVVRLLPARPVSWMLSTMRQTMSLFGPRPLWRAPLCKLMLPHSSSGTSLTMEWTLVGRRRPRLLRRMLLRYHSFQPKFSVGCEIMYCLFFYFVRDLATAHACVY